MQAQLAVLQYTFFTRLDVSEILFDFSVVLCQINRHATRNYIRQ